MSRKQHRADRNQAPLVEELRRVPGVEVAITSQVGNGFPDIVVGRRVSIEWLRETYGDSVPMNFLVEVKPTKTENLRDSQNKFHGRWPGAVNRATTLGQLLRLIGATT